MGKISKALDKAGYQDGIERKGRDDLQSNVSQQLAIEQLQDRDRVEVMQSENLSPTSPATPEVIEVGERGHAVAGPWDARLAKAVHEDRTIPEIFSTLRSRILHPVDSKPVPRTIMVTSAIPGEGKSFITSNLGVSFAHGMDQHALLVDCDLRKPTMAPLFGLGNANGLVDYLRDKKALSQLICRSEIKKLSILPSGKPPMNPSELLSSHRMIDLVAELSGRYEDRTIIFDTPPMLAAAESRVLAKQVDGVILVVRQGKARKHQIQKVLEVIPKEKVIGIVFNDYKVNYIEKSYMSGYGYYRRKSEDAY